MLWQPIASVLHCSPHRALTYAAALSCGAAALLHAWIVWAHAASSGMVLVFAALAFGQGTYTAALLDHGRAKPLLLAGIGGNLAIMALWLVVYLVDVPSVALLHVLHVEQTASLGTIVVTALVIELALVAMLGTALITRATRSRRLFISTFRGLVAVCGILLVAAAGVAVRQPVVQTAATIQEISPNFEGVAVLQNGELVLCTTDGQRVSLTAGSAAADDNELLIVAPTDNGTLSTSDLNTTSFEADSWRRWGPLLFVLRALAAATLLLIGSLRHVRHTGELFRKGERAA